MTATPTPPTPETTADASGAMANMSIGFKLTGKQIYTTWLFAMNTMLTVYGLSDYVDKDKAAVATDPVKKAKTMLAITRNIDLSQLIKAYADDPAGAWGALSAEYAGKTSQDMATLLIELFGMRLQSNASVEEAKRHFEAMVDLNLRLKEIESDRALSDDMMGVLLCMSLPNDMEQVRYRRLSGPSKELTPSNVRDDVISLLRRMAVTADCTDPDAGQAMTARRGRRRGAFTGRCFDCNQVGHRSADCRNKQKGSGGRSHGTANVAMQSMALSSDKGTPRKGPRDWVLDGAATCGHVSACLDHFQGKIDMFDPDKRPSIGGVGGSRIDVHGKGDVVLKMANDQTITLKNVNYVPDAVVNLFAVRTTLSKLGAGAEHRETARSSKILGADGRVLLTSSLRQGLLYLDLASSQDFC
jgi:hypothetical protein